MKSVDYVEREEVTESIEKEKTFFSPVVFSIRETLCALYF